MKLSKLKMNPNNPRKIAPHALQKLMDSIERDPDFMVLRPIVYDPETMQVLGGNQRLAALRKLGHKDIPDQWAVPAEDLTPEQKRRFVLADNGQFGEWDFDILSAEWGDLELADWGIDLPDFKSDFTSVGIAGAAPEDAASGLASKWGVQKGQVWQCGDSTIKDDVDKLLAGAKPELMVTDPPYGVEYDASWRNEAGLSTGGRIVVARNHSKVMAGYSKKDNFYFAAQGSSNLNTNPRMENYVITIDKGCFEFYKEFYDGIDSYVRPSRRKKTWQM